MTRDPGGVDATWTFTRPDHGESETEDPNGNPTTYAFDGLGHVTDVTDALGRQRSQAYNANSNIVARTDAGAVVTSYAYSSDGRFNLTGVTLPTGAQATMAYSDPNNPYAPSELVSPQGNALVCMGILWLLAGTRKYASDGVLVTYDFDTAPRSVLPTTIPFAISFILSLVVVVVGTVLDLL